MRPYIIDTNVFITASEQCERIRDPGKREQCFNKRAEAENAINQVSTSCLVPPEVQQEVSTVRHPRVSGTAKKLMNENCDSLRLSAEDRRDIEHFAFLTSQVARHSPTFQQVCTSKAGLPKHKLNDWRIIAETALKEGTLLSDDRNMYSDYCLSKYKELSEEVFGDSNFDVIRPSKLYLALNPQLEKDVPTKKKRE